ncbi:unnamed protein product [marine sediment metagenome]|uniref:Uncharacterized protein n=1 Tax=marine sediment metagenome TaxID=412755 RepID=X0ZAB9_9ZZZZ
MTVSYLDIIQEERLNKQYYTCSREDIWRLDFTIESTNKSRDGLTWDQADEVI